MRTWSGRLSLLMVGVTLSGCPDTRTEEVGSQDSEPAKTVESKTQAKKTPPSPPDPHKAQRLQLGEWRKGRTRRVPDFSGGEFLTYRLDFFGRAPHKRVTDETVRVLDSRLSSLGIEDLRVQSLWSGALQVFIPALTAGRRKDVVAQIERVGRLQFKILVGDQVSAKRRKEIISVVEARKERGDWEEASARYDTAVYHPNARGAEPGVVLLYHRTPGGNKPEFVDGDQLEKAYRAVDDKGRPAIGFDWGPVGRKQFWKLTSENVGRQMAVVLDGQIRSAPVIRSGIGRRGIIEGGSQGWSETELETLIVTLTTGALPAKPILQDSRPGSSPKDSGIGSRYELDVQGRVIIELTHATTDGANIDLEVLTPGYETIAWGESKTGSERVELEHQGGVRLRLFQQGGPPQLDYRIRVSKAE